MREDKVFSQDAIGRNEDEGFERLVLRDTEIVKPILKEKFLKDYIFGIGDSEMAFRLYCDAFGVRSGEPVRVILFKSGNSCSKDEKLCIINVAERCFGEKEIILSTSMADCVMLIIGDIDSGDIYELLCEVSSRAHSQYKTDILSVYSKTVPISDIPEAFFRLRRCMEYSFYADNAEVVCEDKIRMGAGSSALSPKYIGIEKAVSGGDERKTKTLLNEFFTALERCMPPPAVAKTYCLELYVCIIRCCETEQIDTYMKGIVSIQESKSFNEIKTFISGRALEIAYSNAPKDSNIYSSLVRDTVRLIDENIGSEKLSLRWIAKNHLFTNVDYLGKVFKKEVGMNFSHYVMEKRMELAKELIAGGKKDRIYEVAEKVGYGTNSQYFSQVFKKYTGRSPLEYKETARLAVKQ